MKKIYGGILIFISAAVIISICSSLMFLAIESDHECAGENCGICFQIEAVENLLKHTASSAAVIAVAVALCVFTPVFYEVCTAFRGKSPIGLKTKLSY